MRNAVPCAPAEVATVNTCCTCSGAWLKKSSSGCGSHNVDSMRTCFHRRAGGGCWTRFSSRGSSAASHAGVDACSRPEFRAPLYTFSKNSGIPAELNNLRLEEDGASRPLTLDERDKLWGMLRSEPKVSFAKLRQSIGHGRSSPARFNLESERRKELKGDIVSAQLSRDNCIGDDWFDWPPERQEMLARLVEAADEQDALVAMLTGPEWGMAPEKAEAISKCRMPEDYGGLSLSGPPTGSSAGTGTGGGDLRCSRAACRLRTPFATAYRRIPSERSALLRRNPPVVIPRQPTRLRMMMKEVR